MAKMLYVPLDTALRVLQDLAETADTSVSANNAERILVKAAHTTRSLILINCATEFDPKDGAKP